MKILYVTNNLWSGGVTTYLSELSNYFSKNYEVSLLILGEEDENYLRIRFLQNIKIIFLNQKKLYSLKNFFKVRKLIKENDIIHVHLFPAQYITVISGLFLNKKFIFTEHTTVNKRRKYKMFKIIEKYFIYKKYKKIACVSNSAAENLKKWIGDSKKIIAIPNGINIDYYSDGKNIRKEIWDLRDNEKLISMIARFSKQKDQNTLLKAMTLLDNKIKCIFIGVGDTLAEIKEKVRELKLENRIKFLGHRKDIKDILKSIDLNVLSTHYEGLPLIILESMAANTLILASNVDGNKEILENELLFEKANAEELAEKINRLLYDEELIKKEKIWIKEKIKNYSYEKMFKEYLKIYEE